MKKTLFVVLVLVIGLTLVGCGNAGRNDSDSKDGSRSRDVESEDSSEKDSKSQDVEFEDFLVERCVREALGKSWDEKVTKKELSSLKELTISWKKDITLVPNFYSAIPNGVYAGYVNLADLKYLTGLEDLTLDLGGQNTAFENMDAIADCRQLKSLTMPLPMRSHSDSSGYIGKGYSYLKDIFAQLPELEVVDFGVSVPEPLQKLLQPAKSGRKIDFVESENNFQEVVLNRGAGQYMQQIEEDEDILVLTSEELMSAESEKDGYEKYEDVFIYVESGEIFDCEALADFRNIKTLVICENRGFIYEAAQVIHPEALSALPNLCSLSLYHVQVDFEGCEFPNLRELYLSVCELKGSLCTLELPRLRELSLYGNKGEIYVPGSDLWSNLQNLHYLRGSVTLEECESLADILADMKGKLKLETLVLDPRGSNEDFVDILSQITKNLELKSLYWDSVDYSSTLDLEQIKCNDSLENFVCRAWVVHLEEFINSHSNLSAVVVQNISDRTESADVWLADCNDIIEAAVKTPDLSMLALLCLLDSDTPRGVRMQDIQAMSLYEAGIYDNWIQSSAFSQDMDVETFYQERFGSD